MQRFHAECHETTRVIDYGTKQSRLKKRFHYAFKLSALTELPASAESQSISSASLPQSQSPFLPLELGRIELVLDESSGFIQDKLQPLHQSELIFNGNNTVLWVIPSLSVSVEFIKPVSTKNPLPTFDPAMFTLKLGSVLQNGPYTVVFNIVPRLCWLDSEDWQDSVCNYLDVIVSQERQPADTKQSTLLSHMLPDKISQFKLPLQFLQIPQLKSKLLRYQQQTVLWLLRREGRVYDPQVSALVKYDQQTAGRSDILFSQPDRDFSCVKVYDGDNHSRVIYYSTHQRRITDNQHIDLPLNWMPPGGLLAEEMGLGKTLEILALIALNPQPPEINRQPAVDFMADNVGEIDSSPVPHHCRATLILLPPTILYQWVSEIRKHCPSLRYLIYRGWNENFTAETFYDYDIILCDFWVPRREIYFARPEPGRPRRHERKYERGISPLTRVCFWRLCVDEAQMVGLHTIAGEMAGYISHVNSWAVSGTPEFEASAHLIGLLGVYREMKKDKRCFPRFLNTIGLRHSKDNVEDEMRLPPQRHNLIKLELGAVEQHYYRRLIEEMVGTEKDRLSGEDDGTMFLSNHWFLTLRQACCHPQVGAHNRELFGNTFRSIPEVLELMIKQCEASLFSFKRQVLSNNVEQGLMMELQKRWPDAINIYRQVLADIQPMLSDIRSIMNEATALTEPNNGDDSDDEERDFELMSSRTDDGYENAPRDRHKTFHSRLLAWLSLHHQALFCLASVYKEQNQDGEADCLYKQAEDVRRELMDPLEKNVERSKQSLRQFQQEHKIDVEIWDMRSRVLNIPRSPFGSGGIMSEALFENVKLHTDWLNEQIDQLTIYRNTIQEIFQRNLHENYADDAEAETVGYLYQDYFSHALKLRRQVLFGQQTSERLVKPKQRKSTLRRLDEEDGREAKIRKLMDEASGAAAPVKELKTIDAASTSFAAAAAAAASDREPEASIPQPPTPMRPPINFNFKELIRELHNIADRPHAPHGEITLCMEEARRLDEILDKQSKALNLMTRECDQFNRVWNKRVMFYRFLQRLSDDVRIPVDIAEPDEKFRELDMLNETFNVQFNTEKGRLRYLTNIMDGMKAVSANAGSALEINTSEEGEEEEDYLCQICRGDYRQAEKAIVTVCGHMYCAVCIKMWVSKKRTCPVCQHRLQSENDLNLVILNHNSSLVPSEQPKHTTATSSSSSSTAARGKSLDSHSSRDRFPFPPERFLPIVRGNPSTKISMIVRHIKYLTERSLEPFKCLVFSQWESLLDYLVTSLTWNNIGYVRFANKQDRAQALDRFNSDPNIQVFLLNAKSQAAGLTLTLATHVFLLEPAIHPSVEWQAVGRVHRLGQTRETWVHHYICENTIEEQIYAINLEAASVHKTPVIKETDEEEHNEEDDADAAVKPTKDGSVEEVVADRDLRQILLQEASRIAAEYKDFILQDPVKAVLTTHAPRPCYPNRRGRKAKARHLI